MDTTGDEQGAWDRREADGSKSDTFTILRGHKPVGDQVSRAELEQHLDLNELASRYAPIPAVMRLVFLAEICDDLTLDCLRLALAQLREHTSFTEAYKDIWRLRGDLLTVADETNDTEWIESVERRAHQKVERLENDLTTFRTNHIKESIRMGNNDLGDFFYACGKLWLAMKRYLRTRDYCTTNDHHIQMGMSVIRTSIDVRDFNHVLMYVGKTLKRLEDKVNPETKKLEDAHYISMHAKLQCASALAQLYHKNYRQVVMRLLDVPSELASKMERNEFLAPQEVALYGGICALATFSRGELRANVINNAAFKDFLEHTPVMRRLINDFFDSKYASVVQAIDELRPVCRADINLNPHSDELFNKIRVRALKQYFAPYASVDLRKMADVFTTEVSMLEKELAQLIVNNELRARIDSHNKVLYALSTDSRAATYETALNVGKAYRRDSHAALLRMNMQLNDVVVRGPRERAESRVSKSNKNSRPM